MTMVDMLRRTHADVHRILEKFDKLTQTREKMQAELYDHKVQKKKLDRRALAVSVSAHCTARSSLSPLL